MEYHFTSIVTENPADAKLWVRALEWKLEGRGTWTKEDWDALLGHCMAVSDHPCLTLTGELLEAYPDAKVILTARENMDVWHGSVLQTIWPVIEKLFLENVSIWRRLWKWFLDPTRFSKMADLLHLNPKGMYHKFLMQRKQFYEKHHEKIRTVVPRECLLEFKVKQDWGPLREFLEVDAPKWDFPRVNEGDAFIANQEKFGMVMKLVVAKNVLKLVGSSVAVGVGLWLAFAKK